MPLSIHDPKYWHTRAEEARALAQQIKDPSGKRTLLKIAEGYEELAERARQAGKAGARRYSQGERA